MTRDIIDELRPLPPRLDPEWEALTLRAILDQQVHLDVPARTRTRPLRLALVAATLAAIVGSMFLVRDLLPPREAAPTGVATQPDGRRSTMDEQFPTLPTDRTYDAVGTQDFALGAAPGERYIFYKLQIECIDATEVRFVLNGDPNAASLTCDTSDDLVATVGEMSRTVAAGSDNVLTVQVNHPLSYTLTVGYRTESINEPKGPTGTLPDGRTYGPSTLGADDTPDLVAVVGVGGVQGYVESERLPSSRLGVPRSPQEALAEQAEHDRRYREGERIDYSLPVYDTQGRQVDRFDIMLNKPR